MISKRNSTYIFCMIIVLSSYLANAAERLSVITSIPDFAWLAAQIGGSHVDSKSLLSGHENPHYVDAVPEFIRLVAAAHVVCIVGLELEVGYMPAVLSRSGNAQVQPGGKGYCDIGKAITVLDKSITAVDRSMGDVHPSGNPHYYLSPKAMAEGASVIESVLIQVDPSHTLDYQKGLSQVLSKLNKIGEANKIKLAALPEKTKLPSKNAVIEYHKEFSYFLEYYGISSFGSIEEKPGVPPSAGRIAEVALAAKAAGVRLVLATDYNPAKTLKHFSELSGIPVVIVPTMIQVNKNMKSYENVQNKIIDSIVELVHMREKF